MFWNEKGVILPFSLFLLFLFTLLTLHAVVKYETEKKFFKNIETTYELETIFLESYEKVKDLSKHEIVPTVGEFNYDVGFVSYTVTYEDDHAYWILFKCYTYENHGEFVFELPVSKKAVET